MEWYEYIFSTKAKNGKVYGVYIDRFSDFAKVCESDKYHKSVAIKAGNSDNGYKFLRARLEMRGIPSESVKYHFERCAFEMGIKGTMNPPSILKGEEII